MLNVKTNRYSLDDDLVLRVIKTVDENDMNMDYYITAMITGMETQFIILKDVYVRKNVAMKMKTRVFQSWAFSLLAFFLYSYCSFANHAF